MRSAVWIIIVTFGLAGCGGGGEADLIVTGHVYTMDPELPTAEAVVVTNDLITFVGSAEAASRFQGPRTLVLDMGEGMILPGLVDAHGHLMNLGRYMSELQLVGTASADTIRQLVIASQETADAGQWVLGRGWDQNDWVAQEFPTWQDLKGTETNPVFLKRVDGHAAWLNATALETLGITAESMDPPGGRIIRDNDGNPTGVLIDRAKDEAWARIPEPTRAEKKRRMRLAIDECRRFGLTGVHEAQTAKDHLEILEELEAAGELNFHVYTLLDTDEPSFVTDRFERGPTAGRYVTVRAIKVYADGALGSRGAALLSPYEDERGHDGLMVSTPTAIEKWAGLALANGFQMCTHAIGDRGNRVVIDTYERIGATAEDRFRIEHAQVIEPGDIRRMADLGIVAAMQPTHATSDMYWAEDRIGPRRVEGAYAWRTLIDAGVVIACGSDFPVEGVSPLWGIYAAVTRQDHEGHPAGGWRSHERLTMEEALAGFTRHAAFASFSEETRGTIERGKLADLTILDRDVMNRPARDLLDARVRYTIVAGQIVYANHGEGGAEREAEAQ